MKKISLLLLTTLLLISCSSDNSSDNTANGFYIGNNLKSTNNGYFTHEPLTDGSGYKNLIILSDGAIISDPYDADDVDFNSYSNNTSNLVILTVNSTSQSVIEEGTYNLDTTQFDGSGNLYWSTFISGITMNNNAIENYSYESYSSPGSNNPITAGSIIITKTGTQYNLNYTFQQNGSTIHGTYVGALTELEYTE